MRFQLCNYINVAGRNCILLRWSCELIPIMLERKLNWAVGFWVIAQPLWLTRGSYLIQPPGWGHRWPIPSRPQRPFSPGFHGSLEWALIKSLHAKPLSNAVSNKCGARNAIWLEFWHRFRSHGRMPGVKTLDGASSQHDFWFIISCHFEASIGSWTVDHWVSPEIFKEFLPIQNHLIFDSKTDGQDMAGCNANNKEKRVNKREDLWWIPPERLQLVRFPLIS